MLTADGLEIVLLVRLELGLLLLLLPFYLASVFDLRIRKEALFVLFILFIAFLILLLLLLFEVAFEILLLLGLFRGWVIAGLVIIGGFYTTNLPGFGIVLGKIEVAAGTP